MLRDFRMHKELVNSIQELSLSLDASATDIQRSKSLSLAFKNLPNGNLRRINLELGDQIKTTGLMLKDLPLKITFGTSATDREHKVIAIKNAVFYFDHDGVIKGCRGDRIVFSADAIQDEREYQTYLIFDPKYILEITNLSLCSENSPIMHKVITMDL